MSLARDSDPAQSTSDGAPLFLLSPVALRPVTSHARIEGGALYTKGEREVADLRPIPRKNFLPQLAAKMNSVKKAVSSEDTDSDTYRQKMWAGQANIVVTVRLRPLLSHDRDREQIVKVLGHKEVVVRPGGMMGTILTTNTPIRRRHSIYSVRKTRHTSASPSTCSGLTNTRSREKRYAFDYVFSPQDSQQKVYQHTTKFLIHGVLNGFNATVFAYGCTGAGKTHTMLGTTEEPGIMARTLEDLFRNIERVHGDPTGHVQYRVTVSFLEVYNENIRDLLSASSSCSSSASMPTSEFLDLREDPVRGSVVAGLSEVEANNANDVMKLLRKGNKYRSQESTAANSVSSRSHAVLQVHIEQQEKLNPSDPNSDPEYNDEKTDNLEVKFGKLSLVDLAGSERAAVTQNRGQRLLEGANINRSLLALGNCINALGEKGSSGSRAFVPYRDSKLTRLLKDSLGGNCRTVMIANVSLAASSVEETLNTLKYANRAKNIKTTVRRNIVDADQATISQSSLVANLKEEIATLKKQLQEQETSRQSMDELGWVQSNHSCANNCDSNNTEDEDWKASKLREARQYISECFQERCRLHRALLKLEHKVRTTNFSFRYCLLTFLCLQIQNQTKELQASENVQTLNSPNKTAPTVSEPQTKEQSGGETVANITLAATTAASDPTEEKKKDMKDLQVSLAREREGLMQQLGKNERAMDEFRRGIEQSPLMERNELIREVLLMEYRIGKLEIDKMQLQTLRDLQMGVDSDLVGQQDNNDDISTERLDVSNTGHIDVPTLDSDRDSGRVHLPEIKSSKASGRGGFFEELREHLYPSKSRGKHHDFAASPVAYHKPWGLHLNNTSLPYIRLKKKNPVPLYVEPTTTGSLAARMSRIPSTTSLAEPYLKSLKNRHKQRSKKSKNTIK
ncbi:Kinesin-like protein KIF19 [Phytophthora citrophthora]|uniref:Kinesin-like protein n=1 Tax=Phytophthora citrophthora TaxID=4793 RepID=A0AAD9G384_9STRA|nr:Kinesin-like protein KIF19 [Phytophthora citrophthora]